MQVVINLKTEFTLEVHFLAGDRDDVQLILDNNKWNYNATWSVHLKRVCFLIFDMNVKRVFAFKKLLKDKSINNYY